MSGGSKSEGEEFIFLNSLHPEIFPDFPSLPKERHQTLPFSAWNYSLWKITDICEVWHGRTTTSQKLYPFFPHPRRNLCCVWGTPALFSWQGRSWGGHRPQSSLHSVQSSARFQGVSPAQGQNLFLGWRYKRANLFPFTLYHIKHIPTHRTTPTLFGRKINGEASSGF